MFQILVSLRERKALTRCPGIVLSKTTLVPFFLHRKTSFLSSTNGFLNVDDLPSFGHAWVVFVFVSEEVCPCMRHVWRHFHVPNGVSHWETLAMKVGNDQSLFGALDLWTAWFRCAWVAFWLRSEGSSPLHSFPSIVGWLCSLFLVDKYSKQWPSALPGRLFLSKNKMVPACVPLFQKAFFF